MVNTVIIGAGDIARKRHIPAILQAEHGVLYGFYNRTASTTDALAEEYQARVYHSLQEVLDDDQVRAVLISTPPTSHAEVAVQALQAGKQVLLEKPMTLSLEEAQRIVEAEEKSSAKVTMLHVQRYYAPHKMARTLLERGEIGQLLTVRTYLGNADFGLLSGAPHQKWNDALFNVGIHRIDLLRFLVGSEVEQAFGHCSRLLLPKENTEENSAENDHAIGIFQFQNGVLGTMIASRTSFHGEDRSTVLIGTEGTITTYTQGHDLVVQKRNGEKVVYDFPGAHAQKNLELTDLHERFFRSVLENTEPEVNSQDGLKSVKIALALERSNQEGKWIALE